MQALIANSTEWFEWDSLRVHTRLDLDWTRAAGLQVHGVTAMQCDTLFLVIVNRSAILRLSSRRHSRRSDWSSKGNMSNFLSKLLNKNKKKKHQTRDVQDSANEVGPRVTTRVQDSAREVVQRVTPLPISHGNKQNPTHQVNPNGPTIVASIPRDRPQCKASIPYDFDEPTDTFYPNWTFLPYALLKLKRRHVRPWQQRQILQVQQTKWARKYQRKLKIQHKKWSLGSSLPPFPV